MEMLQFGAADQIELSVFSPLNVSSASPWMHS